jgi:hypothetical protein
MCVFGYQRRPILLIVLVVLLASFGAVALWGPQGECVDVVDYCDPVI